MNDDLNNLDLKKEDREYLIALIKFAMNFTAYVGEMDPELFRRAAEYASDFTKSDVVTFTPETMKDEQQN